MMHRMQKIYLHTDEMFGTFEMTVLWSLHADVGRPAFSTVSIFDGLLVKEMI